MESRLSSDRLQSVARQLLAYETAARSSAGSSAPPVVRVCEALRRPLCVLAGTAGFRALLGRALALARARAPALGTVNLKSDGTLEGLNGGIEQDEFDAGVVLISQLLGLLAVLIGENLTLTILVDVWPDLRNHDVGGLE
jgi:hypothetical protein